MCKYCEGGNDHECFMSVNMKNIFMYMDVIIKMQINPDNRRLTMNIANGTGEESRDIWLRTIEYCPFCGRALGHGDQITKRVLSELTHLPIDTSIRKMQTALIFGTPEKLKEKESLSAGYKPPLAWDSNLEEWEVFFNRAVIVMEIPYGALRTRTRKIFARNFGKDVRSFKDKTDKELKQLHGVGKSTFEVLIKLRDYAKDVY